MSAGAVHWVSLLPMQSRFRTTRLGFLKLGGRHHSRSVQRGQECLAPMHYVVAVDAFKHGLPALFPLLQRHVHCRCNRDRNVLDVIGIDQQCTVEFSCGAGKTGQDKGAGFFRVLRGNIFLRHQIHPVAKRGHQTDAGNPVKAGQKPDV